MPQYNSGMDDEPMTDGSVPISGINNSMPPNAISSTLAAEAENRLAESDGLNRPRPGVIQRLEAPVSFDSIHHLGNGKFLWNDASNWFLYNSKATGTTVATTGTTVNGGPFIKAIPTTVSLIVGMSVSGIGIQSETKVVSIDTDSQVTISKNATLTFGGATFTFADVINAALTGGPAFGHGDQVYSALADQVLYFTRGGMLNKFVPSTNTFGINPTPPPFSSKTNFPLWAFGQLLVCMDNNIYVSNLLDPEVWNSVLQSVTLDPVASDVITGQVNWQRQTLAVFRNGSTWIIETGPNLDVVDWEVHRASATVGCCTHGTIVQCGVDVFFLSETGRGVYALSQVPTSDQLGVWQPISSPIKRHIDRINWAAIHNARACYWNDLYMLSVPLDDSLVNNAILAYSVTLNAWQGVWQFDFDGDGVGYGFRDSARDRTNADHTLLLYGTVDGFICEQTYPPIRQYYDSDLAGKPIAITSRLLTRSFTFGQSINQIQPHSAKIQFLESLDSVDVCMIADRTVELSRYNTPTSKEGLSLPIPKFTFNLTEQGYYNLPLSLGYLGICNEIQIEFEGDGNWTVYQIKLTAYEAAPLVSI